MNANANTINASTDTTPRHVKVAKTADGKLVILWTDGQVTWSLGSTMKGIGVARAAYLRRLHVEAGLLALGEAELFDADEFPRALKAAREMVRLRFRSGGQAMTPGEIRETMATACDA